jgi:transcription elongation factor GreA
MGPEWAAPVGTGAVKERAFVTSRFGHSAMEKVPIRREGLERLQNELKQLKSVERPAIIRAIAEAREHGDLSENAEYHAARDRQSFIEGRVAELEDVISRAEVIDSSMIDGDTVTFGTTIKVADEDTDEESTYTIVGPYEADISKGLISTSSPIARALIGKRVGDSAEVTTPRGVKGYEILTISVS